MAKRSRLDKQAGRGTAALLESLAELETAVGDGLSIEGMKRRFPTRVRLAAPSPREYSPSQVKALREKLGVSQADFSRLLGVSRILVQGWERGIRKPSTLASRLLDTIDNDPPAWLASLGPSRTRPKRAS